MNGKVPVQSAFRLFTSDDILIGPLDQFIYVFRRLATIGVKTHGGVRRQQDQAAYSKRLNNTGDVTIQSVCEYANTQSYLKL